MIKYYLYLDNIRLIKRPVMRAAAENRRRKRVHAHIFVSPGLYGDAQICVIRPLWVLKKKWSSHDSQPALSLNT